MRTGGLVSLVPGGHAVKDRGKKSITFAVGESLVDVFDAASFPTTPDYYTEKYGGRPLREERDQHHVAFAVRVREPYREDSIRVFAFARGLACRAKDVPDQELDEVFNFCASLRRGGDLLEYAQLPEITSTTVFGLPAIEIYSDQFAGSRLEWTEEMNCDSLLEAANYKQMVSDVEILNMPHGEVRTYWSSSPDTEGSRHNKVWAVRGKYCCGLEMASWFEPAPAEDVRALATICDQAAQPGWPQSALPDPIKLEE